MKIFARLLFLAFFGAVFELNAAEIEPLANKFEAGVLKKAAGIEDLPQRAKVLFGALSDERAGAPLLFNAANAAVQISEKAKAKGLFLAARERLEDLSEIKIYQKEHAGGVLLFHKEGISPTQLAARLDKAEICVRAGLHCAPLAHQTLGSPAGGTVRVSVGYATKRSDCDALWRAMKKILSI